MPGMRSSELVMMPTTVRLQGQVCAAVCALDCEGFLSARSCEKKGRTSGYRE